MPGGSAGPTATHPPTDAARSRIDCRPMPGEPRTGIPSPSSRMASRNRAEGLRTPGSTRDLGCGARGYVLKGARQEELIAAIRAVARGEAVFGAQVADRVLAYFAAPRPTTLPLPELTAREREILHLLVTGLPTTAIASRLALAPKTVRNHLSSVFTKLHVADRAEAVRRAREAGLGD